MARVTLELPASFPFATEVQVLVGDINYGRHLGNDAVLRLAHEARLRFLAHLGLSEMDVGGCGLIMADAVLVFRAEAFHGDRLRVEVAPGPVERASFDLFYRLGRDGGAVEVARVKTGLVFFDYGRRRVVSAPASFRAAVAALAG